MGVKERRTMRAAANSAKAMQGMYNYGSVDKRVYQTEKKLSDEPQVNTRIRSEEELKAKSDSLTTVTAVRNAEKFLSGDKERSADSRDIRARYHLSSEDGSVHGDAEEVFEILKENFPAASFYRNFSDLYYSMRNRQPLRTEPVKIIRTASEKKVLPVNSVSPIYQKGDRLWTYGLLPKKVPCPTCGGSGKKPFFLDGSLIKCLDCDGEGSVLSEKEHDYEPTEVTVEGFYTKKLAPDKFDIMYELDCEPKYAKKLFLNGKKGTMWRLQGNDSLFTTREEVEERIRQIQEAGG